MFAGADHSIDLLWFAWRDGDIGAEMAGALAERARAGVRVRVLVDGYGARHVGRSAVRRMRLAGCEVLSHHPVPSLRPTVWDLRTHRQVLVCDEVVAFTGGTGISGSWTGDGRHPGQWRDTVVRVRGPAVAGLRAAFAQPWLQAQARRGHDGPVSTADCFPPLRPVGTSAVQVLRPPSGPGWNDAALALGVLFQSARTRVRVASPYVRLPGWLRSLVCDAARRGVEVQLLVSGPHVERPTVHLQAEREYEPLLEAGVQIWRYQASLLHTKIVTVDGELSMVGTTNLDVRSLALTEQACLLVADHGATAQLDTHVDDDLTTSAEMDGPGWRTRSLTHRVLETTADVIGRPLQGWSGTGSVGQRPGP